MKKFTYIFLLASCLLLASCESWLDEDPQYTLNTQIQFSTSEKARAALYGCYGYFALTSGGYGQHWQEIPVRYSGFGWANNYSMARWSRTSVEQKHMKKQEEERIVYNIELYSS